MPVVKDGKLVGIVTDRDLRRPKISDVFKAWDEFYRINEDIQVEDIMTDPVLTISEDATLKEAAKIMAQNRIGGVPVTDKKGKLDGIITESDVLRAFASDRR
ncbi:MAG: CBS domain-containing protein [Candidatus Omnitrophica bacterium]|nr:CBS domain-containing protein [Candidatus Omnitrophota bacterium]